MLVPQIQEQVVDMIHQEGVVPRIVEEIAVIHEHKKSSTFSFHE